MRGLQSTIALLAVLIGLCAYIYFVTSKTPESGTETTKERVFVALDADKIDELKVKSESGETTSVKKDGGTWQMTAPLAAKGDEIADRLASPPISARSTSRGSSTRTPPI